MKKNKILQRGGEYVFFTMATIISSAVHFVFSIISKKVVEPFEFGIYSSCLLLQTYVVYIQLGALNAFNRDYPQLIARDEMDKAKKYRNTVFTFLLVSFMLMVMLVIGIMFLLKLFGIQQDTRYLIGFVLCSITAMLSTFENFSNSRARIDKDFILVGKVVLLQLISVGISIGLLPYTGYYTLYLMPLLSSFIGNALLYRRCYADVRLSIDCSLLKEIILSGFPLLISGLIWTIVNSIDKMVILNFLDTEALGIYGIAQNAFSFMVLVPTALSQIFYVKMSKEYAVSQKVEVLNQVSMMYTSCIAILSSIMAVFALFLLPPFVQWVIPSYSGGVPAAQILILGLAVYAPTLVNGNILTILKKNAAILRSSVYLCIFNLIFSIVFLFVLGMDITSVAYGTALSYVLRAVVLLIQLKLYADASIVKMFSASMLSVAVTLVPAIICYRIISNVIVGLLISLLITVLFYAVLYRKGIYALIRRIKK